MLQGVHHICLKAAGAEEFQRVLALYEGVLGFPILRRWGEGDGQGAMLDLGNVILEVMANGSEAREKGRFPHIALRARDVDAAVRTMEAAGFPAFLPPTDKNLGGNYPVRIAFCTGPAGEDIEFFQEY